MGQCRVPPESLWSLALTISPASWMQTLDKAQRPSFSSKQDHL